MRFAFIIITTKYRLFLKKYGSFSYKPKQYGMKSKHSNSQCGPMLRTGPRSSPAPAKRASSIGFSVSKIIMRDNKHSTARSLETEI